MRFLGHNFGSRHARRSSKGSINTGDHLVSKKSLSQNFGPLDWRPGPVKVGQKTQNKKSLSQNFGPLDWRPGPVKVGQKTQNPLALRASPRRTPHPNKKISFLIEPRRLAASVEGLNNSLAIATGEL